MDTLEQVGGARVARGEAPKRGAKPERGTVTLEELTRREPAVPATELLRRANPSGE